MGKYDEAISFSDIYIFSFVSYLCHLSIFLCFLCFFFLPLYKWKVWISCFQTVLPGAFLRLGWAQWRQWKGLASKRRKGLLFKISNEARSLRLNNLRIMRLDKICLVWRDSPSVICLASQSPLLTPISLKMCTSFSFQHLSEYACVSGMVLSTGHLAMNETDLVPASIELTGDLGRLVLNKWIYKSKSRYILHEK